MELQCFLRNNDLIQHEIFISYNKEDVEFAERLVRRLERDTYNGNKIKCFFAPWDIAPGENIVLRIEEGLTHSKFIVLILSPSWLESDWTKLERAVPVYDDPAGMKGRIIPILRRNCDIPPSIRILRWLDFRTDRNFEREVKKLIARIIGLNFRSYLEGEKEISEYQPITVDLTVPYKKEELIVSNLFQVIQMPKYLNCAKARVKSRNDVWKLFPEGVNLPPFAFNEENQEIYTFSDIINPQQKLIQIISEQSSEKMHVIDVINSDKSSILIEILNRSMTAYMQNLGMIYDWKYQTKKTYYPLENNMDDSRYATWKVGGREYKRFLVKKTKSNKDYVHRSCKALFTIIGDYVFLKILPGWHFTIDGIEKPVNPRRMTSLSSKYMNIERNHSILNDIRFWIFKLSKGKDFIELNLGEDITATTTIIPFFADSDSGIEEDYRERLWYEGEPEIDEAEYVDDEEIDILEEEEVIE